MSPAMLNFWTAIVFIGVLLAGWLAVKALETRRDSPENRVRGHLYSTLQVQTGHHASQAEADNRVFQQTPQAGPLSAWLSARRDRLKTVCGTQIKAFVCSVIALSVLSGALLAWILPASCWVMLVFAPAVALVYGYHTMVQRFKKHFLAQFPDALDLIIRAVRAGVPANQAISAAGKEFPEPLRTEFTLMGDGLRLGIDIKDVLDDADKRIGVAEFSFFCVCLMLQRETGGQLTETLENLGQIIRARRDLGLKARALTAEPRAASVVIALVPVFLIALLWFFNRDYIVMMFTTDNGQFMLKIAVSLILFGLYVIHLISDLKV